MLVVVVHHGLRVVAEEPARRRVHAPSHSSADDPLAGRVRPLAVLHHLVHPHALEGTAWVVARDAHHGETLRVHAVHLLHVLSEVLLLPGAKAAATAAAVVDSGPVDSLVAV